MSMIGTRRWNSLEQWRQTAFLVAGAIFVIDAALLAYNIAAGVTDPSLALGQAFVGAAWTAAFVGLLGMYPSLSERNRWLARIGAVFAGVGGVVMAAMAVASLGYYSGVLSGDLGAVAMYFLPGVFLGIVLGFGAVGVATLRSDTYSTSLGLLFLLLPLTFLFNLASGIGGFGNLTTILAVVVVLSLTNLAIGNLFRTGSALAEHEGVDGASDASVG